MSTDEHTPTLLAWARKLQALAQNGLTFSRDPFDRERYTQLQELAAQMLSLELAIPTGQARAFWEGERGYATPKVDVRGDRKSTRLNSSHSQISYAVFCLKKKKH